MAGSLDPFRAPYRSPGEVEEEIPTPKIKEPFQWGMWGRSKKMNCEFR